MGSQCQHGCLGQLPRVYKTKSGQPFMRTGAGSAVGVSEDEKGRVFFFDRAATCITTQETSAWGSTL